MKREEIKKLIGEITPEQLDEIMNLNGADIEREKAKRTALEKELSEIKSNFENLNSELETLKATNANGEEWKAKFEALQTETEAKAKQAEADRILQEKETKNREMFEKAVKEYGKTKDDWLGSFNEEGYYNKFIEAISAEENAGRSHRDVLHDLVKNDRYAFKGVEQVPLAGGSPRPTGKKYQTQDEIMAIKDRAERRQAIKIKLHRLCDDLKRLCESKRL